MVARLNNRISSECDQCASTSEQEGVQEHALVSSSINKNSAGNRKREREREQLNSGSNIMISAKFSHGNPITVL